MTHESGQETNASIENADYDPPRNLWIVGVLNPDGTSSKDGKTIWAAGAGDAVARASQKWPGLVFEAVDILI